MTKKEISAYFMYTWFPHKDKIKFLNDPQITFEDKKIGLTVYKCGVYDKCKAVLPDDFKYNSKEDILICTSSPQFKIKLDKQTASLDWSLIRPEGISDTDWMIKRAEDITLFAKLLLENNIFPNGFRFMTNLKYRDFSDWYEAFYPIDFFITFNSQNPATLHRFDPTKFKLEICTDRDEVHNFMLRGTECKREILEYAIRFDSSTSENFWFTFYL